VTDKSVLTGDDRHVVAVRVVEEVFDEVSFSLKAVKDVDINAVDK